MSEIKSKIRSLTEERVNLIVAACAILISAASFYATYLQANAAEKQVRAMTLPLLQFEHGNHNPEQDQLAVGFSLKNAGVGPAIIRSVELIYRDKSYSDLYAFFAAIRIEAARQQAIVSHSQPLRTVSVLGLSHLRRSRISFAPKGSFQCQRV